MIQWEYFDLWTFLHEKAPDLNLLGKDCWELVSVIHMQESQTTVHYFKRPIPQPSTADEKFEEVGGQSLCA